MAAQGVPNCNAPLGNAYQRLCFPLKGAEIDSDDETEEAELTAERLSQLQMLWREDPQALRV